MIKIPEHEIKDPVGIHARPAGKLVTLLKPYKSKVTLLFGEKLIDAKSLISMMKTGIKCGDVVSFVVEGDDEEMVRNTLLEFLKKNF